MEREFDTSGPERAEDLRALGVDCNVDDHIAVTSTTQFIGNADYLNHQRRELEDRRASLQQTGTRSAHLTHQRIGDEFRRWSEDYLHRCSKEILAEANQHGCTHTAFEDLEQIRERISDGKKFQQWAFNELQQQVAYKTNEYGIVVGYGEPPRGQALRHSVCSACRTTVHEPAMLGVWHDAGKNRDERQSECLDCSYSANGNYSVEKTWRENARSNASEGRTPPLEGCSVSTP